MDERLGFDDAYEQLVLAVDSLRAFAEAASLGATHSGSNEGRAVLRFADAVAHSCGLIVKDVDALWRAGRVLSNSASVSHAEVSHAKTELVSHGALAVV